MTSYPEGPSQPGPHHPLWLAVVGGPKLGETIEVPRRGGIVLAPLAPTSSTVDALHWDIGAPATPGAFQVVGRALAGTVGPLGCCNLFAAMAKDRFHAGDLLEWGEVAVLVGEGSRNQAGAFLVAFLDAEAPAPEGRVETPPPGASLVAPVPVPRVFHSEYSRTPFAACLVCERDLLTDGTPYVVEKSYRGRETILECALCVACAAHVNGEISDESRRRLVEFGRRMLANGTGIARCRACQKPRTQASGFNLMGSCVLDQALPPSWMVLCEECLDGLEATLSEATRERYRDFVTDHFPGLPADLPSPVFFAP